LARKRSLRSVPELIVPVFETIRLVKNRDEIIASREPDSLPDPIG